MTKRKDTKTARKIAVFIKKHREKIFPGRGGKIAAAEKFGNAPASWSTWESGKTVPDDVNQRKLAKFFGVSLAQLRGDHEKPPAEGEFNSADILEKVEELRELVKQSEDLVRRMSILLGEIDV